MRSCRKRVFRPHRVGTSSPPSFALDLRNYCGGKRALVPEAGRLARTKGRRRYEIRPDRGGFAGHGLTAWHGVGRALKKTLATAGLLVSAGTCIKAVGDRAFTQLVNQEVDEMVAGSVTGDKLIVTDNMLDSLPDPMQRYLRYAGVVGKPVVNTVCLAQTGRIRLGRSVPWALMRAKAYYSAEPPGFVWDATVHMGAVAVARARDMYFEGEGKMLVKAGSLFTVADANGDEMDQASMVRYLSEMTWFPSAFLLGNVSFEAAGVDSARVSFTDHGRTVTATLTVDSEGRLTKFVSQRYRMVGRRRVLETWSAPVYKYGFAAGLRLPVRAGAVWKLADGDLEYFDVWVDHLRYDALAPGCSTPLAA